MFGEVVEPQGPGLFDENSENAAAARKVADRRLCLLVDAGDDETLQCLTALIDDPERCILGSRQLGGGLHDLLQDGLERELGRERDASLEERAKAVGLGHKGIISSWPQREDIFRPRAASSSASSACVAPPTQSGCQALKTSWWKPGSVSSAVLIAPPSSPSRSSTQTWKPPRASSAAQASELIPLPTTIASKSATVELPELRVGHEAWRQRAVAR